MSWKILVKYKNIINYNIIYLLSKSFDINVRDKNKRTNLGNIYLDDKYTIIVIIEKVNTTSFKK
jgi:hypothetical protein